MSWPVESNISPVQPHFLLDQKNTFLKGQYHKKYISSFSTEGSKEALS